ncbi:hypothetical protein OROGR_007769 [Orobanche gracilis]
MEKNEPQIMDNMDQILEVSYEAEVRDCRIVVNDLEKNLLDTDLAGQSRAKCAKMAAGSTNNLSEVNANTEMKEFEKKAKIMFEVQSVGTQIDEESRIFFAEGNVNEKRKRRGENSEKKKKNKDEIQSMDQADKLLQMNSPCGDHGRGNDGKSTENYFTAQRSEVSSEKYSSRSDLVKDKENSSVLCTKEESVVLPDVFEVSCRRVSSELLEERSGGFLRPMEVEAKLLPFEYRHCSNPNQMDVENPKFENGLSEVSSELVADEGKCLVEEMSVLPTCDIACGSCPQIAPVSCIKRKLIVLDVNGLLANIVFPAPKDCRGDTHILGRAVFKRPFCDDFLKFCFENFDVGIWSSRSKKLIDRVVEYLLGNLQDRMMFCWDMSHSTQTGFKTLENCHKPLVFKELRKIWESDDPNLPWKKGYYNESNTLLLDDSPYKALLNPLHTAIFPNSYHYEDKNDTSLGETLMLHIVFSINDHERYIIGDGNIMHASIPSSFIYTSAPALCLFMWGPGGDIRVYLEGLLTSENVQKYVEQHPFGQNAINESSLSWGFYSGVLQTLSIRLENNIQSSVPTLSQGS